MAVFTPVSPEQLETWLEGYSVGTLRELNPIASGIENTNYFVTTTQGRFVLTLFERLSVAELDFYLHFMAHLSHLGMPCPRPIPSISGAFLGQLNGKPAGLVSRLPGTSCMRPEAQQCAQVGRMLARMHSAGASFPAAFDNPRGPHWWRITAPKVMPYLAAVDQALLQDEVAFQERHRWAQLPRGVVHADLFRDNVLFDGDAIGGVIDFYFAGRDAWLFDLAVTVNDWCTTESAQLDPARNLALLSAYQEVRTVTGAEREAWPVMLRAAALRFWLSRLDDYHRPRPGELIHPHDPEPFRHLLQSHIDRAAAWPAV
jgi:homoserine kinase type II